MTSRIYLDNAATSWPKSEAVYEAVDDYQRNVGAAAGRGTYAAAQKGSRLVQNLRAAIRRLFDASPETDVIFTHNGTDSLNLCLSGVLQPGDHVLTSVAEHNSVLRPLAQLSETRDIEITYVSCEADGVVLPETISGAMRPNTRLVAITHASNVTGAIQPIEAIAAAAHRGNAKILIDAAQTAGHVPISLSTSSIDLFATSGHKGMGGPLGNGVVCLAPGLGSQMTPHRVGGTGGNSESLHPPTSGPERFEAGNLNMPGLAGLAAAVSDLLESGSDQATRIEHLTALAIESLLAIDGVHLLGPLSAAERVGLVSFTVDGIDCHEVAAMLESAFQIEVRAGLHCAPQMHAALGFPGTVRASWSHHTRDEDILRLAEALQQIAATASA